MSDGFKTKFLLVISLLFYPFTMLFDNIAPIAGISQSIVSLFLFLGGVNLKFFTFYSIGALLRKHWDFFENKFITSSFLPICILIYFTSNIIDAVFSVHYGIIYTITSFSGSIVVFSFFYRYQYAFSKATIIGKMLQYLGKRTLDIYWLHYFFIPYSLLTIYPNIGLEKVPLLEIVCSFILATLVVCASLIVSAILRSSSVLGYYIFGAKKNK